MESVTQKSFHYFQSRELIREEIRNMEDEMGDSMAEDGKIIEVLNEYLLNIATKANANRSIAVHSVMLNSLHVQLDLFSLPILV